jgi:DNA-binding transcriptional LysR family regulator
MNLHQLRTFFAVATTGSVTAAARSLTVSQPGVSKQLAELEAALGVVLVERLSRGVRLTEAGRILERHAARVFAAERAAESELQELRGLRAGSLHVGASTTIGNYLLPPVLARFRSRYPAVELTVTIDNTLHIQAQVLGGALDFGLTEGLIPDSAVTSEVIGQDKIVLIASPSHRPPASLELSLEQLAKVPIILRESGSGTRDVVEEALRKHSVELAPVLSLGGTEAVKNAVAAGLGFAFVSALSIERELATTHLVEVRVRGLEIKRDLYLSTLPGKRASAAAGAFIQALRGG